MRQSSDPVERLKFDGPLSIRLQTPRMRKTLAILNVVYGTLLGFIPATFAWFLITPATAGVWFALACGFSAVMAAVLERLLFISIQTALPIDGKPYDEWQQQLFTSAQVSARKITYFAMVCLVILGLFTTYWGATSGLLSTVIPLYIWVSASLFFWAYEAPYLILAWRLPDDAETEND
ncbi:MAG: hypothetical protein AB3N28_00095 [Kordiimonas sp.]